jgi:small subunit ribosomal protein S4
VSVPSFLVGVGDEVQLRSTSKLQERVADNLSAGRGHVPQWLELAAPAKSGIVRSLPLRDDIQIPVQEQLIVELYSK